MEPSAQRRPASPGRRHGPRARPCAVPPVVQQRQLPSSFAKIPRSTAAPTPPAPGAVVGAIVGGVAGDALATGIATARAATAGSDRGATTAVGAMTRWPDRSPGGKRQQPARLPDRAPLHRRRCIKNRTLGYDVTYEYAGRTSHAADHDPGPWIPIRVQPEGRTAATRAPLRSFVGTAACQSQPAGGVGGDGKHRLQLAATSDPGHRGHRRLPAAPAARTPPTTASALLLALRACTAKP